MQWNYQKIEYFLKAAQTLNFSKAARELFVSPQSLNKQIIQMEQELGEPLFGRTTRKVELTPLGREMQQAFEPVQEAFARAVDSVEAQMQRRKRSVRIAFFQAISKKEAIIPIMNYLRAQEPDLQVQLMGGEIDEVIEWLYQGKCDLVITNIHDFEVWPDAEIIPFVVTPAQITVSLYHPWMVKDKVTVEDMENMPILLLERKKKLERDSFYRNIKAKERMYASNFDSLLANLSACNCYAVIPKLFESMNQMGLRYLDLPQECRFNYRMAAIFKKGHRKTELFLQLRSLAEDGVIGV